MRGEEIQAALLYAGAVSLLWAFLHGFAELRMLQTRLGQSRHAWLDWLVIFSMLALLVWPFFPGNLIEEYRFADRWHVAVLAFIGAWVVAWFGGWLVLMFLAPVVGNPARDELGVGDRMSRLVVPVMCVVVVATVCLWVGTYDRYG